MFLIFSAVVMIMIAPNVSMTILANWSICRKEGMFEYFNRSFPNVISLLLINVNFEMSRDLSQAGACSDGCQKLGQNNQRIMLCTPSYTVFQMQTILELQKFIFYKDLSECITEVEI